MGTWRRKKGAPKFRIRRRNRLDNIRLHKLIDWDDTPRISASTPLSDFEQDIEELNKTDQ